MNFNDYYQVCVLCDHGWASHFDHTPGVYHLDLETAYSQVLPRKQGCMVLQEITGDCACMWYKMGDESQ